MGTLSTKEPEEAVRDEGVTSYVSSSLIKKEYHLLLILPPLSSLCAEPAPLRSQATCGLERGPRSQISVFLTRRKEMPAV